MALLLSLPMTASLAFSLDDLERLERIEQTELLDLAREAARNWRFGKADDYLDQARNKGYAPDEIAAVKTLIAENRAAKAEQERHEEEERRKREEQRRLAEQTKRAQEQQAGADASGNMGGALDCKYVSSDYGLWNYCKTGTCSGLSGNYGIWSLCENNDFAGLSSNYGVWSYLKDGDPSGLSKDYKAWRAAKRFAGSFADRKRFVIYYLRGYVYGHY
jgi:hypothetical protein